MNASRQQTPMRSSILLFVASWLVYTCAYIARGNFSFARNLMIETGVISVGVAGLISAVYFICYAVGQMINGVLADRYSPFIMVFIGLCIVFVSNLAMALALPQAAYVVLWGINGCGQSMLWSPVFFIASNLLHEGLKYRAVTLLSVCVPAGKISCGVISGIALSSGRWQSAFSAGGFLMLGVALMWVAASLVTRKSVRNAELPEKEEKTEGRTGGKLALLSAGGFMLLIVPLVVHGLFYNGIVEVIPSILASEYGLSASNAALLDTVIPIVGISGAFIANALYRMFRKNEIRCAAAIMLVSLVPLGIMLAMALIGKDGYAFGQYVDAAIFVVAYGAIYVLQLAFNYMLVAMMPMRYAGFAMAATVSGLINAVNYGGSAISTYGMSYAVSEMPLWATVIMWIACVVLACVFLYFAQRKWTKFSAEHDFK